MSQCDTGVSQRDTGMSQCDAGVSQRDAGAITAVQVRREGGAQTRVACTFQGTMITRRRGVRGVRDIHLRDPRVSA